MSKRIVALILAAASLPAIAQTDGASVLTRAYMTYRYPWGELELPGCASNASSGLGLGPASVSLGCLAPSTGGSAAVALSASASGPSGAGGLPELRAAARIDLAKGASVIGTQQVRAWSMASYADYIWFDPLVVHSMSIDFVLTGSLAVNAPSLGSLDSRASTAFTATVSSGLGPVGGGSHSAPYGQGLSRGTSILDFGQPLNEWVWTSPSSSADYSFAETSPWHYHMDLGPSFFTNPDNTHLRLDLGLVVDVQLALQHGTAAAALWSVSDFGHTLAIADIRAFDALGDDVTAQHPFEFQSVLDVAAIPEPGSDALLGLGLVALLVGRRRR